MVLSQAQHFNENGYVQVKSVFTPTEVDNIRTTFTRQVESPDHSFGHDDHIPTNDILAAYPRFVHPHRRAKDGTPVGKLALQHMMDTRLVGIVEDLVGPCYGAQSMFYFKPPGARGQAFHQDNMSLQAAPEMCVAAWIAIDRADAENGGLRIVPGSHKQSLICPESANPELSFSNNEIHLPATAEIKQTELDVGDVLFFHGALVHGSLPNKTRDRFRRALIFHYIPQGSREVAKFYLPLIDKKREEVYIEEAEGGGACGEGWVEEP